MSTSLPLALHRTDLTGVRTPFAPPRGGERLPEPPFPRKPALLTQEDLRQDGKRQWTVGQIYHAWRGWATPVLQIAAVVGRLSSDRRVSVHRVQVQPRLPLLLLLRQPRQRHERGGRPRVDRLAAFNDVPRARPDGRRGDAPAEVRAQGRGLCGQQGVLDLTSTNGRLLQPEWIDRLADAGVATFNFAVDAVDEKPGLPKALNPIRKQFEYLVRKQYRYGYTVFLNINICRNNLDDVKQLTEIARENRISTDYHINEMPLIEQPHFKHLDQNPTYIRPEDRPQVCEVLDWLIEKQKSGYMMTNSVERLAQMKDFMHGDLEPWNCRAGQNTLIIRVDGTLAPCFPMYSATHGAWWDPTVSIGSSSTT